MMSKTATRPHRAAVGRRAVAVAIVLVVLVASVAVAGAYAALAPATISCPPCTGGGNPTFTSPTIDIGYLTELSGLAVSNGYAARIGADLAVAQANAAGGVDGKTIDLVVSDDQDSPSVAVQGAAAFCQQGVLAVTGPTDQADALAVEGYAESVGMPFVISTVSSAQLTPPGLNWTVAVEPDSVQWGAAVAKYISEAIPGAKLAMMTQNAEQ